MGAQGSTTINFGTFPGTTDATATVTGQTGILSGSLVEAWIPAVSTTDHSVDEHWADPPYVTAGNIVAGTGFTIYGKVIDAPVTEDSPELSYRRNVGNQRLYGQYTVFWVWN